MLSMEKSKYQIKYEEFINNLNQESKTVAAIQKIYKDFIMPTDECNANLAFGNSFKIDDADIYIKFLEKVESCNGNLLQQIFAVQSFVDEYFGIGRDEMQRRKLNESLKEGHSIKEYKGKNVAMCFERATLAHNLFNLIGVDCSLILKDGHAYNMLQTQKRTVVYDVTNLTQFKENDIKKYMPSFVVFPKIEAEEYLYGDKTIELNDKVLKQLFPNATEIEIPDIKYKGLNLEKQSVATEELGV